MSNPRAQLLAVYDAALAAVQGAACVRRFLSMRALPDEVYAVAVGKAAASMLEGARAALGERLCRGLLITKHGYAPLAPPANVAVHEAGHPYPDAHSLAAGGHMLQFIEASPAETMLLFLISGGASSLVEALPAGMSLDELSRLNRWLVGSGWDIRRMNVLRKRLSAIKGGRLAARLCGRRVVQLLISDVPGDDPRDIGSGLLVADEHGAIDETPLPEWLRAMLQRVAPPPLAPASAFAAVETHIVASLDQALSAAAAAAGRYGYPVRLAADRLGGDAAGCGRRLAHALLDYPPGLYLWGGETAVALPAQPGRGGRNQYLALAAAEVLAGHDDVWLLCAATDGSDGPGNDAGALVDGGTIARGALGGLDAGDCLRRADAGRFLEASGDLIVTGPTGTNVMDLVIGVKH